MIRSFFDLEIYQLSHRLAMQVFQSVKTFPSDERYSLTSQVVRSSRSIAANIAEGWGKRIYESEFKKHLIYSTGSLEETKSWLRFALDCQYINEESYQAFYNQMDELGAKLNKLHAKWKS